MSKIGTQAHIRHTFFGHNSLTQPFKGQLNWNGSSGDYLSIDREKSKLWWLILVFDVLCHFGRKMDVASMCAAMGPTRWTFWANNYLNIIYFKFAGFIMAKKNILFVSARSYRKISWSFLDLKTHLWPRITWHYQ